MQIINLAPTTNQFNLRSTCRQLVRTLANLGLQLIARTKHRNKQDLIFRSQTALPKSRQPAEIIWQMTVSPKTVKTRMKLCEAEDSSSWGLASSLKQNWEELCEFVAQINNLKLNSCQGFFYLQEATGELGFQSRINGLNFISSPAKLVSFLRSKLQKYLQTFLEELEVMIFYFKIPGFSLQQYELTLQPNNHVQLQNQIEKINAYREYFELKGNLQRGIPPEYPHLIMQNCAFLYGNNCLHSEMTTQFGFTPNETITRLEYDYQKEKSLLANDLDKYQTQGFDPILTTIEIKERIREKIIGSGGFSEIFFGIYSFIPQLSVHQTVNSLVDTKAYMKTGYHLVRKRGNQKQKQVDPALKNEFSFLYYIRNKVCPYFAKYYCNNTIMPFSDGELYLQYYPCSLADCRLNEKQKMKIMEDICMGLLFLNQEGIIHRDLKELNIMVDRKKRGRLIDFGSVCSIFGKNRFKPFDDKIRSTVGYFLPYSRAEKTLKAHAPEISRQHYYTHRNFDQYGLGKIIHNEFFLDHITHQTHFLRYNLLYLASKCLETNPEDRLTMEEVIIFLRQLMIFNIARSQFWHKGFDEQCKPHVFGLLEAEREMKAVETTIKPTYFQQFTK